MSVMGGSPDNVHQAECAILCRPGGRMKNDGGFIAWAIGAPRGPDNFCYVRIAASVTFPHQVQWHNMKLELNR